MAFAVSKLCQFNKNPSPEHHQAADDVIRYLYHTRTYGLRFGGLTDDEPQYRAASDASHGDAPGRKSTQGYVMQLFGGTFCWKSAKQDTVTLSTTEAELLALTATAKEVLYTERLMKELQLRLDEDLVIEEDNKQTLRLVCEESIKLNTRLRHVDIHNHWLRQEVQAGRITVKWVQTTQMIADGFTKCLPKREFEQFVGYMGLEDITERLSQQDRQKEVQQRPPHENMVLVLHGDTRKAKRGPWITGVAELDHSE